MSLRTPPQWGQVKTSMAKTRLSSSAQVGLRVVPERAGRAAGELSHARDEALASGRSGAHEPGTIRPGSPRNDANESSRFVAERRTGAFQLRRRREHAVMGQAVRARPGHERREALEGLRAILSSRQALDCRAIDEVPIATLRCRIRHGIPCAQARATLLRRVISDTTTRVANPSGIVTSAGWLNGTIVCAAAFAAVKP